MRYADDSCRSIEPCKRIWCASGGARCTEGRRAPTLVATRLSLSQRGEPGVNCLNDYRSFSDGGGDPLHRPGAHVTNGEDAGEAGLKDVVRCGGIRAAILSCQDEAAVVQSHGLFEPSGAGIRTDHD